MRYTHLTHEIISPTHAGIITKTGKTRPAPILIIQQQQPTKQQKIPPSRLPNSQRHLIRKASISTGGSSFPASLERRPSEAKKLKAMPELEDVVVQIASPRERRAASKIGVKLPGSINNNNIKSPSSGAVVVAQQQQQEQQPRLRAWEAYLHWLCLTEEPGTLWASSLCATFHECLMPSAAGDSACSSSACGDTSSSAMAAECAARVDDIYWSFYLPLDPLMQFMEDRILSGYLLHVWTMFVELGKRIPHDDPAQDKLVELLKELVHLPPMEVRTWEVSLFVDYILQSGWFGS